jgi:hypothetical protein
LSYSETSWLSDSNAVRIRCVTNCETASTKSAVGSAYTN